MRNMRPWTVYLPLALIAPVAARANGFERGDWYGHGWGGGMIFGPLMMIAFVAVIVVLIVLVFRWLGWAVRVSRHQHARVRPPAKYWTIDLPKVK